MTLTLTLQGHSRSHVVMLLDAPYVISYCCLIVTHTGSFTRYKPSKSQWPWQWPFKVNKVKYNCTNGLPIHTFLLMFNSNIWPTSAPLYIILFISIYLYWVGQLHKGITPWRPVTRNKMLLTSNYLWVFTQSLKIFLKQYLKLLNSDNTFNESGRVFHRHFPLYKKDSLYNAILARGT